MINILFVIVLGELVMSKYRKSVPRKRSKRMFSKTAQRVHRKNGMTGYHMRGGIRL
jgi:hypothetical protein